MPDTIEKQDAKMVKTSVARCQNGHRKQDAKVVKTSVADDLSATLDEDVADGALEERLCTGELNAIRKHKCFLCSPFHGRACGWAMLGEIKT